jgi:hypothetical protein
MTALPSHKYGDPLQVLINKENAIENRLKGCKGCRFLNFDASGARIVANCDKGRKVGRKGKCSKFKEAE